MVMKLEYPERAYLNHGDYKPCKDISIGAIIEYLQQFPPGWRIKIGEGKAEPVLIDADIDTIFTTIGEQLEP